MKKLFLVSMLALSACAPKLSERVYPDPKRDFNPRLEDVDLQAKFPEIYLFDFNTMTYWSGESRWGTLNRQIEHLLLIGKQLNEPKLIDTAVRLLEKSREISRNFNAVDLSQAPFSELAISQTQEETKKSLVEADQEIAKATQQVLVILDDLAKQKKWNKSPMEMSRVGAEVSAFLLSFKAAVAAKEDLYPPMKTELLKELEIQSEWVLNLTQEIEQNAKAATTLDGFITPLKNVLEREKLTIDPKLAETLKNGQGLAQNLTKCRDAQSALTVLIDVWRMLTPEERKQYIKPANEGLYDHLEDKEEKYLKCMQQKNCNGFFRDFVKDVFILPKVEKYGPEKICKEVNDQGIQFAQKSMRESGPGVLATIPQTVKETLEKTISEKRAELKAIHDDFPKFVRDRVQSWSKDQFKSELLGFEPARVQVELKRKKLTLSPAHSRVSTTSEAVGSALSLYKLLWDQSDDKELLLRTGIEQVNRMVALGGYKDATEKTIPAFLAPLDEGAPVLDLNKVTTLPYSYAMADEVSFNRRMEPETERLNRPEMNYSAKGQAEMVRGLSAMIQFFQDWETTSYEKALGKITAQELVPDFQVDELNQSVFPKSDLLALSIAEAATLLKNIQKKYSQFFLVDLKDKILWASDYDMENGETAVIAGLVDIVRGDRAQVVRAEDVSRMIIALSSFLDATSNIEMTKSELLLQKGEDGKSAVETLAESRHQIKMLIIGLTNLISHQFVSKDGSVARSLRLQTLNPDETEERSILDQALAIRALISAARVTEIDIYRLSALDLYYAMNQRFYNPKMRFYSVSQSTETLPLPVVLETIAALSELKPMLPEKSQEQLTWVLRPWIEGLKTLE